MENAYEIEKTFQVEGKCEVDIRNINGTTQIESWEQPEVRILARKRAKSAQADEATEIKIGQDGDTIFAKTKVKSDGDWLDWLSSKMRGPAKVDYYVKVPADCVVATSMVSGETSVTGIEGKLRLNTVSGDATLVSISGNISLNSVSGDIEATELTGDIRLNTVSGDIVIKGSDLTSLQGNTVSGDIRAETPLSGGKYSVSSVSGDVRLVVPPDTRCSAKLTTLSGELRTNLRHEALENKRTVKLFDINGGGVSLGISSVSGDLRITTEDTGPEVAARPRWEAAEIQDVDGVADTPIAEVAPVATRMEILTAIESGDISVQEGLARLQELPFDEES